MADRPPKDSPTVRQGVPIRLSPFPLPPYRFFSSALCPLAPAHPEVYRSQYTRGFLEEVFITRVSPGDSSRSLVSATMQEDREVRGKNFLSHSR